MSCAIYFIIRCIALPLIMNSNQSRKNPSYHRIEFEQTLIQLKYYDSQYT